jgi:glycosyltransferase involved in cell wall biosynthesis
LRTLVVTAFTPTLGTGRAVRAHSVVAALAHHGPVDVLYQVFDADRPDPAYEAIDAVTLHRAEPSRRVGRVWTVARTALAGAPLNLARAASPELVAEARRLADAAGRVIADGPTAAAALLPLARRRDMVYLAYNLESGFRHTPALERFERRVLETFAQTWMATAADAEGGRRLAPAARELRVVHNVVDVAKIRPADGAAGTGRVLMVADWSYAPNREGLVFLLDEVMPRVWERAPEATLALAGRRLDLDPADGRVLPLGFVDDVGDLYRSADAVAVPLLHGGGSPLKFVEALAHGVPAVATAHAAALLEGGRPGEHFLAAPDAAGFAEALVRALRGEAADVAVGGRRLAEERYSVASIVAAVAP